MRPLALPLLALLVAPPAQGATLLVPDFADRGDPTEGIRARAEILRGLGAYPQISIAPLFKFKRLAKRYRLRRLDDARAAALLGRREGIDGLLAGAIRERGGAPSVQLTFFDATGRALAVKELPLVDGEIPPEESQRLAAAVASLLGLQPAAPHAPAEASSAPPSCLGRPGAAPPNATAPPPSLPPAAPSPAPSEDQSETLAGPLVTGGLFVPFALRSFDLDSGGQPLLHFGTDVPYSGIGGDLAVFPLRSKGIYLRGLGAVAEASIGFLTSSFSDQSGNTVSFASQDIRFDADLDYRLSFADVTGTAYVPGVDVRAGWALFRFQVSPDNPAGLQTVSRSAPELALLVTELLGPWLRLSLGGRIFIDPTPGAEMAATYGPATSSGFGLELTADGRFGLSAAPGLGYQASFAIDSFQDHYGGNGTGIDSGDETYDTLTIGLTYSY